MNVYDLYLQSREWRYEHHGRTEGTVDCYGWVMWAYRRNGVVLPDYLYDADGKAQKDAAFFQNFHRFGHVVSREELREWDSVVFTSPTTFHMGIMLDGSRFAHCCRSGVVINNLSDQPYCRKIDSFYRTGQKP